MSDLDPFSTIDADTSSYHSNRLPDGQSSAPSLTGLDLRGYELSERLGAGGMGEVYRASDPALGRDLAVKVMKGSYSGDAEAEGRFLREAHITGGLQHPSIVPVHNLGRLADGRLHYTMRLVRGQTFSAILKQEAGKPERMPGLLAIFEKVCQAVAYAHSKRVIHRDLKPSNVMVGRFGEVQVMDWGLAKQLNADPRAASAEPAPGEVSTLGRVPSPDTPWDLSQTGRGMGTPSYMPPEQARGEWDTVDERADVFSLGAMLCEILTGRPPYTKRESDDVLQQAGRGDLAEALERLRSCGADAALAALCCECLAPRSEDRPRDAEAVAQRVAAYQAAVQERLRRAELERAQAEVKAREERKRRRWAVVFIALLLSASAVSICLAVWAVKSEGRKDEALQLKDEALQTAQARLGQVEKSSEVMTSIFEDLNPYEEKEGGPTLRMQMVQNLERAAAQLDEQAIDDPLTLARIQSSLGTSLTNLSQTRVAIELLTKAHSGFVAQLGSDHPDTLKALHNLAVAYREAGERKKALPLFEQVAAQRTAQLGADHPDTLRSMDHLASAYLAVGQIPKAVPLLEQILAKMKAQQKVDPSHMASVLNSLAVAYRVSGKWEKAVPLFEEALAKMKALHGPNHPNTLASMNNLASAYYDVSRFEDARRLLEQVAERRSVKLGPNHLDTLNAQNNLAAVLQAMGQVDKAVSLFEKTLEQMKTHLTPDHPDTLQTMNNLASAYQAQNQFDKALALFEQALAKRKAKLGPNHPETLISMNDVANAYQKAGQLDKAIPMLEQTLEKQKALLGATHPYTLSTVNNLASAYQKKGRLDKALPLMEETLANEKAKLGDDHPDTLIAMGNLALGYQADGQLKKAVPLLEQTLEKSRTKLGPDHPATLRAMKNLVSAYEKAGELDRRDPLLRELVRLYEAKGDKDEAENCRKKLRQDKTATPQRKQD